MSIKNSLDLAILSGYDIAMIETNISTLKNELSAILRKVRKGEEVIILDRNQPVAKISKLQEAPKPQNDEALMAELERRGMIKRATKKPVSLEWLQKNMVRLKSGASAVEALLKDREEARY